MSREQTPATMPGCCAWENPTTRIIPVMIRQQTKEMEAEEKLKEHHDLLESIVAERTAELTRLNEQLQEEIEERTLSQEKLQRNLDDIIRAMSRTLEERDPYTAGHQKRTTELSLAIAREMGLPEHKIKGLELAGLIHDMGKISVPSEILSKPGGLNDAEHQLIKRHPQVAYDILPGILPGLLGADDVVRRRWDHRGARHLDDLAHRVDEAGAGDDRAVLAVLGGETTFEA